MHRQMERAELGGLLLGILLLVSLQPLAAFWARFFGRLSASSLLG